MKYRTMTENDAEFLTTIFSIPEYELYFAENETSAAGWKERIPLYKDKHSLIISDGSRDVGWLMYRIEGEICFIDIIVLLPSERYKGYGRQVINDLLEHNPEVQILRLDVQKRNQTAVDFYRKLGFTVVSEEYQPVGDTKEPYYNMQLTGKQNMNVRLIKLNRKYERQLGEMIDEWKLDQILNNTNHSPWSIFKNDYHDFDYYLENLEISVPRDGLVPDSVFFLLDEGRDRLLGAVNIRHYLNDYLLREGGHIGDGIRPSERRKGYATEMIRLALEECRKLGIDRVLMICYKDNIASARSIINNGGVLENEETDPDGTVIQRYWITL